MPLDGTNYQAEEVAFDLSFATGNTGLLRLARLLELEQTWRDTKMTWDFGTVLEGNDEAKCGTSGCAIGLALVLWPQFRRLDEQNISPEEVAFDLSSDDANLLFYGLNPSYPSVFEEIEPHHVAKAIREFVAMRQSLTA